MTKTFDADTCRENICEKCPSTKFGATAICSFHNKHIGTVEECEAWANAFTGENGQMFAVVRKANPTLVETVHDAVHSYKFMHERIGRITQELAYYDGAGTAQYGIESTMPRGQGGTSDKTGMSVQRRMKKEETVQRLRRKIELVDRALKKLTGERDRELVMMLLEDRTTAEIAQSLQCSMRQVQVRRNELIEKLAGFIMDDAELMELYNRIAEHDSWE